MRGFNLLKKYYLFLSLASLVLIENLYFYFNETNLPPLTPNLRYCILALIFNCLIAFYVTTRGKVSFSGKDCLVLALIALALCFSGPVFSGDLHYYIMRGRILTIYGQSPYLSTPSLFPNDLFRHLDFCPFNIDAYGPLSVYFQSIPPILFPHSIMGSIWCYKFQLLLLFSISALAFFGICKLQDKTAENWPLYAFSPMVLIFAFIDGHNDTALMSLSVISVFFLVKRRYLFALIFWTLSFAFKYLSILILPFLIIFYWKTEFSANSKRKVICLLIAALTALGILAGLYANLWAGSKMFEVLFKAQGWFYNSSIPYVFWKTLTIIGVPVAQMTIKYIFLITYLIMYIWLIRYYMSHFNGSISQLADMLALVYTGFYLSLISPLMPWYWLWMLPWLILSNIKNKREILFLFMLVALICFWKRINYLTLIAAISYGAGMLILKLRTRVT